MDLIPREIVGYFRSLPALRKLTFLSLIGFVVFSSLSISLTQAAFALGVISWLLAEIKEGNSRRIRLPLLLPFLALAGTTLLSAATSANITRSLIDSKQLSQILIFYLFLNNIHSDREAGFLFKVLVAVTGAVSVYGLYQILTTPAGLAHRIRGPFSIYMTFSGVLLLVATLALAYGLIPSDRRKWRWVYCVAFLIVVCLLSTYTRNAWVGLLVGTGFITVLSRNLRALFLIPSILALIFVFSPKDVRERAKSIGNLRDPTVSERLLMWRSGLEMVKDHPLTGVGVDMVKLTYGRYANPKAIKQRTGHLHNNPLQIAAERGLLGLAAWLWIWVAYYVRTFRVLRRLEPREEGRFWTIGSMACVSAFLMAGMFEYNYGDSEVVMLVYFIMALAFLGTPGLRAAEQKVSAERSARKAGGASPAPRGSSPL
ncbi:MAG: O-antigen ligase family protein [Nitrospinota bacterium]